jgi:hypothetical protein
MSTQDSSQCPDGSLGPWAGSQCRGGFDFTLLFEETVLSLTVQGAFLLLMPMRYLYVEKQPIRVRDGIVSWAKLVSQI